MNSNSWQAATTRWFMTTTFWYCLESILTILGRHCCSMWETESFVKNNSKTLSLSYKNISFKCIWFDIRQTMSPLTCQETEWRESTLGNREDARSHRRRTVLSTPLRYPTDPVFFFFRFFFLRSSRRLWRITCLHSWRRKLERTRNNRKRLKSDQQRVHYQVDL